MMRYFRLLFLFLKASFLVELEYRANFLSRAVLGLLWVSITILSTAIFFGHTDTIGGWSFNETLIIAGLFTLMGGIIQALFQPNVQKIIEMVRVGTLDFVLTKPVNSQFLASLRYSQWYGLVDVAAGSAIIIIALSRMGYAPDPLTLAAFALMLVLALLIVYSIWVVMATLSFWFVKVGNLTELFNSIYDTGRFPVSTFQGLLRILLTVVVPIAFITTFPAQAVLGRLDVPTLLGALFMAGLLFGFSAWFWRYAVSRYSSASS
jgi:ABC-2 type transport system permease protein